GRKRRTLLSGDFAQPLLEAFDGEAADSRPARVEPLEEAPELLPRRGQVHEDEASGLHRSSVSSDNSIKTPLPASGCRKTTFLPSAPGTGRKLMRRNPRLVRSATAASMSRTPKQM